MDDRELYNAIQGLFSRNMNGRYKEKAYAMEVAETLIKKIAQVSGFKPEELVQYCTYEEVSQVQKCTNDIGYVNSLDADVYAEMDKLIKLGLSNAVISERLGVHRNTVSRRRTRLGLSNSKK